MEPVAIDQTDDSDHTAIPVRGHRFRDWIARLGRRLSFEGLENPPQSQHFVEDDRLRIEIALPGFQAKDVEIFCEQGRIEIGASHTSADERNAEIRRAELVMSIDDRFDPERGSADLRSGRLAVSLPVRESAKKRRVPIRSR